jgi:uncharacterized protein with ParB-like and HNH nuclease domain
LVEASVKMTVDRYASDKKTIGELLSTTGRRIAVPEWRRRYSWDTRHVDIFWRDMMSLSERYPRDNINHQEYLLGSILNGRLMPSMAAKTS